MGLPAVLVAFFAGAGVWVGTRQLNWPPALAALAGIMACILMVGILSIAAYQ